MTEAATADPEAPAPGAPDRAVRAGRPALGPADLAILSYGFGLLVLWAPFLYVGLATPRMALLYLGIGPGIVVIAGLARRRERAACWAIAYLLWALVAALVARHPRLSLIGSFGSDVGWLYLVGYFSAWGLGRRLSAAARRLLPGLILTGVLVNAGFAVLEGAVKPTGDLALQEGRALGLMANGLFLAGVLVGGVALLAHRVARAADDDLRTQGVAAVLIIPLAAAANLTGSRAGLVGSVLLAIAAIVAGPIRRRLAARGDDAAPRSLRPAVFRLGLVAAALVVGLAVSLPLQDADSSANRLGAPSQTGGFDTRYLMWGYGLDALAERPIAGWGPGRFREATAPRVQPEFVRAEGPDRLFFDAHNVLVEHLVTTGVVGLALLLGFAVAVAKRSRGPLAWFAGGVALTWLVTPLSVCTGPIALLALGAAYGHRSGEGAEDPQAEPASEPEAVPAPSGGSPRVGRLVGAAVGVLGLLFAAMTLTTDALIDRSASGTDPTDMHRAEDLYLPDPTVTGFLAEVLARDALDRPTAAKRAAVLEANNRSIRMDPDRDYWWARQGFAEVTYGTGTEAERYDRAERAFKMALRFDPWSARAMVGMRSVAEFRKDDAAVKRWDERLCRIGLC